MFSGILVLHYQAFILFSLIPTLFIDSYHSSFLFNGTDIIHLISSLLILITSLYLLSFSINLDSILCSMYYDLSISYPYLSLITNLSCYSISFSAYSYPVSSIPIHFIGSHFSIRHRTQLLISIHFHINTPYPLPSFMLFHFYPSIHILIFHSILSSSSSLITLLHSHSSSHHSSHSFLSTSSSLPHSLLFPSFILFHLTQLSFPLLPLSSTSHSLIRFSPYILFFSLFPYSFLFSFYSSYCFSSTLSTIVLFHIHSHTLHSVRSLLSNPLTLFFYSYHLLLHHSYSFPYSLSFNHFFYHIINHYLLLFPSHFDHSFFNKHNNQIST